MKNNLFSVFASISSRGVIMTNSGGANDDKIGTITTISFWCKYKGNNSSMLISRLPRVMHIVPLTNVDLRRQLTNQEQQFQVWDK